MYHAIGAPGEPASRFVLPARRFGRQLRLLSLLRYRVLSLAGLLERLRRGDVPGHAVVLTLDDGYADNRLAFAELARRGFPATLFAVSRPERNEWEAEPPLAARPLFSPGELRELGPLVEIGAHTRSHPALTSLDDEAAREEIAGSRRDLESALGRPVTLFAYPYGAYDERVRRLVEEAGFEGACTVAHGRNPAGTPPLELRRLEIEGTCSLARFLLTLLLGDTHLRRRWRGRRRRSRRPTGRGGGVG
jgi:peptidoglycan/xylan/chitin deacetylase (PgdA/CDA1 family)